MQSNKYCLVTCFTSLQFWKLPKINMGMDREPSMHLGFHLQKWNRIPLGREENISNDGRRPRKAQWR